MSAYVAGAAFFVLWECNVCYVVYQDRDSMAETVTVLYDDVSILLFRRMCARYSCGTFAEGCFLIKDLPDSQYAGSHYTHRHCPIHENNVALYVDYPK